jgi:cytochrome c-type biogenesis protein
MMDTGLAQPGLAFTAGLLTVAAPCVLPLLPVVLGASVAGGPDTRSARPVFIVIGFALSFTLLALVFGSVQ